MPPKKTSAGATPTPTPPPQPPAHLVFNVEPPPFDPAAEAARLARVAAAAAAAAEHGEDALRPTVSPYSLNFAPYLPPDAADRLNRYKYAGEDHSYVYSYFWKPLCAWLVEKIPMWVAPNVITVGALAPVIVAYLLLWWYMPDMQPVVKGEESAPAWLFVFSGIACLVYQLLDNLDGHQARRTKTSSPLGLLMDHGCDAINVVFNSISVGTAVALGPTWKSFAFVMIGVVVFFLNTWEEFYRGVLVLPVINAPNEGLIAAVLVYMYTAVVGSNAWLREVPVPERLVPLALLERLPGFRRDMLLCTEPGAVDVLLREPTPYCVLQNSFPFAFMVMSGLVTAVGNFYQVYVALRKHRKRMDCKRQGKPVPAEFAVPAHGVYSRGGLIDKWPFIHAFNRLMPMLGLCGLAVLWFIVSPTDIFSKHPRIFCWTIGFLVTKLTLHLIVAHTCAMEFHPFRRTLVPFFTLAAHAMILWLTDLASGSSLNGAASTALTALNEQIMLFEFFVIAGAAYLHAVVNIMTEVATALNRQMFSISEFASVNEKKKQ